MADNYLQPVNNHFDLNGEDLEDVDDDIFLNSSRTNSRVSGHSSTGVKTRSTNPFEDQTQIYAEKRRQIEARTIDSTQKSLGLLYETEEVGKATAIELAKQREQLEKTSNQLDEINSTLRFSQRHLNGLKSVFGGLKNYLAGNRDPAQSPRSTLSPTGSQESTANTNTNSGMPSEKAAMSPTERYDDHPISRIRNDSTIYQQREQMQQQRRNNPFEMQLEANLEEMCGNLSRLKCLATDLGGEIESQNELLDNMNYKIEDVDIKMTKQNKEMNKLLGKK
ncbi:soluble NSF attachment protein 29-like [Teleopsis dalmanni]|uniref:soluble NSF attachment protein 29-like n=1 Tax=Teleopsis dalmanni TaxID=139649 RepID=UPI0018CE2FE2|nr:soluble NSF attachment protein 29-like [Teleopsis dalmanni]XP_037954385.1 soluble NSF attachment protein 29-like [Teleopsis dalmanni]XP_037954520.1 soluble NSF attachment protein 29-like [Teleopsis dalmanni]